MRFFQILKKRGRFKVLTACFLARAVARNSESRLSVLNRRGKLPSQTHSRIVVNLVQVEKHSQSKLF